MRRVLFFRQSSPDSSPGSNSRAGCFLTELSPSTGWAGRIRWATSRVQRGFQSLARGRMAVGGRPPPRAPVLFANRSLAKQDVGRCRVRRRNLSPAATISRRDVRYHAGRVRVDGDVTVPPRSAVVTSGTMRRQSVRRLTGQPVLSRYPVEEPVLLCPGPAASLHTRDAST